MQEVCVALGMHGEGLVPAAAVCVTSLIRNLDRKSRLAVYFLYDSVSEDVRHKLQECWEDTRLRLSWVDARGSLEAFSDHPMKGSFLRLLVGEFVPNNVDRLIWLDLDLLIQADLTVLWRFDLEGSVVAAVPDPFGRRGFNWHGRLKRRAASLQRELADQHRYFNAGVMLLDLQAWRHHDVGKKAMELYLRHPLVFEQLDQDVLNLELQGRVAYLNVEWNVIEPVGLLWEWDPRVCQELSPSEGILSPSVRHFAGMNKPWTKWARRSEVDRFSAVLRTTVWHSWLPTKSLSRGEVWLQRWFDTQWLFVRAFWWPRHPDLVESALTLLWKKPWLAAFLLLYLFRRGISLISRAILEPLSRQTSQSRVS